MIGHFNWCPRRRFDDTVDGLQEVQKGDGHVLEKMRFYDSEIQPTSTDMIHIVSIELYRTYTYKMYNYE